ncbi:MAG TPA: alpha/beta hydrolase [Thermomicrobiales bacterium]|nr:alpha/beta hydrolase [Thermomicrobiales bacterium]
MTTRREPVQLWSEGAPELAGTASTDYPTITACLPSLRAPTAAIVVCPGGGYQMRADHEGQPIAEWLAGLGVAGIVLDYRVAPHRHPVPLGDAQRAMRMVRANAATWNIDPGRVGILGFSAGGHLAGIAATQWDMGSPESSDPVERESSRPDVAILCYAVLSFFHAQHMGSMQNLTGQPAPPLDVRRALSADTSVTADTPPTFLWSTADDEAVDVENSLRFASQLRHHGVPFSLHVFPHGQHGLGLAEGIPEVEAWSSLCAAFLAGQGFVTIS